MRIRKNVLGFEVNLVAEINNGNGSYVMESNRNQRVHFHFNVFSKVRG